MRKSVIATAAGAAALLAFGVAGCGGGGTPHQSSGAGGSTGTLSPYQQQKLAKEANRVCDNIRTQETNNVLGDMGKMTFNFLVRDVQNDVVGWSRADAIAWIKQVAKDQCPEYLGNVSRWDETQMKPRQTPTGPPVDCSKPENAYNGHCF
jgi:hypothetical protein